MQHLGSQLDPHKAPFPHATSRTMLRCAVLAVGAIASSDALSALVNTPRVARAHSRMALDADVLNEVLVYDIEMERQLEAAQSKIGEAKLAEASAKLEVDGKVVPTAPATVTPESLRGLTAEQRKEAIAASKRVSFNRVVDDTFEYPQWWYDYAWPAGTTQAISAPLLKSARGK